jgi:hypothetical protein
LFSEALRSIALCRAAWIVEENKGKLLQAVVYASTATDQIMEQASTADAAITARLIFACTVASYVEDESATSAYAAAADAAEIAADAAHSSSVSYYDASDDANITWSCVRNDALVVERYGIDDLIRMPLWWSTIPSGVSELIDRLSHLLAPVAMRPWRLWFDRVWNGSVASDEVEWLYVHPDTHAMWKDKESGFARVTAWIDERLRQIEAREVETAKIVTALEEQAGGRIPLLPDLSSLASPLATLLSNGKLGLSANPEFDPLKLTAAGFELVDAQESILKVIDAGLPTDAPRHLKTSLAEYTSALPLTGRVAKALVLDAQFPIIVREIRTSKDREWLAGGVLVACKTFQKQHPNIVKFAKDYKKREAAIANASFDEAASDTPEIRQGFRNLSKVLEEAVAAGIAEPEVAAQAKNDLLQYDALPPPTDADRFQPGSEISVRKRWFASRAGWVQSLIGVTALGGGATTIAKDGAEAVGNISKIATAFWSALKALFG